MVVLTVVPGIKPNFSTVVWCQRGSRPSPGDFLRGRQSSISKGFRDPHVNPPTSNTNTAGAPDPWTPGPLDPRTLKLPDPYPLDPRPLDLRTPSAAVTSWSPRTTDPGDPGDGPWSPPPSQVLVMLSNLGTRALINHRSAHTFVCPPPLK